ncbi:protein Wiz [Salarias fasciatus]|uniref:protein Wiz n=1 Tax=Salarias fasciatus TaxID=181472 RepID=UPI001176E9C9|nr:protein Wiz-like [Salarias fasciatus]
MEPPGTSNGPPPFKSAQDQDNFLNCTLESSCSPSLKRGLMSSKCPWGHSGDGGPGPVPDPGRSAQRSVKSSAFPSSLSWDSDSERETLDEEELQNFSNPHGLAAHSPGSPSAGLRREREGDHDPEKPHHFQSSTDTSAPLEGQDDSTQSTKPQQPNTPRPCQAESADGKVWNVSEGSEPFLSKVKPKEVCQMEGSAHNSEGETALRGTETKEPERDVYTFPGDSDPESPPPAPWAHCTFIQRCRKKRVLLRPFSGLGTAKHPSPESPGTLTRPNPPKSKNLDAAPLSPGGGLYDFEEVSFEEGTAESVKFRDRGGKSDKEEAEEEGGADPGKEIFTCVECSIYFKKQIHLQEHMMEHCEGGPGAGRRFGKGSRFRCVECGWTLPNRLSLAEHHRRHQESRQKILAEIQKLNQNESASLTRDVEVETNAHTGTDPEVVQAPPLSPEPVSTPAPARTPAQTRAAPAYRRRFVCTKCNFSTRTSQALANHSKTHNRKRPPLHADAPPPGSPSGVASTSLACAHCAFLTSSQAILREHQLLVHPEEGPAGGMPDEGKGPPIRSNMVVKLSKLDSASLSESRKSQPDSKSQQGPAPSEDSTTPDGSAAPPTTQGVFKSAGNRRFSRRGKLWADPDQFEPSTEDNRLPERDDTEQDQDQDQDQGLRKDQIPGRSREDVDSSLEMKPRLKVPISSDDCSSPQRASQSKAVKDEDEREAPKDGKVFFLRRSARVTAAPAESDSEDDDGDIDEERVRRFLSEGILDEDNDEIDEDTEALRSVERKCPYCPDRFHNGIGLANHVRGHLNRVGVSYNVRHFISPEEVKAIEKKFSYQKKKKKVANFDPDTFSVMHCEFCSAGFDTRAGLSSHARAHLRDFGITNWDVTISPIHILRELFSSRPDLVIPTAPPRSLGSPGEEEEEEEEGGEGEEGEGIIEVKLEGDTSDERTLSDDVPDGLPAASPRRWKKEDGLQECDGDEEEAGEEEDDEDELLALDGLSSGRRDADGLAAGDDADAKVRYLKCEVCGARFETRRGLSSHARSHLRQLGITVSESSGAPIDLLYQIAKDSGADGEAGRRLLEPPPAETPPPPLTVKDEELDDMDLDQKPIPLPVLARVAPPSSSSTPTPSPGASPAPAHSGSPSSVVKKAPISSLLPVSSPLRSSEHKAAVLKSLNCGLSAPPTIAKPLWAPQENDAPLNLTLEVDPNKDIVCQLCGAWFETRKGLSSHARAHLRHFGVEYSESKGSPIDLLNQLIDTDDFKHKASTMQLDGHDEPRGPAPSLASPKQSLLALSSAASSSSSPSLIYKVTAAGGGPAPKATSSSASSLLGPPTKRPKSSSMQVFRLSSGELMALPHSEPPKEIGCEFCGEYFENRKGLSSHARSHLRQMGITEWSVNGSPIDTLREIITRRGLPCALPLKPLKTPPPSSPGPPRSPLSPSSSPSGTLLGRLPFAFARPSSPPQSVASKSSSGSSGGLLLKIKPEPVQLEVTAPGSAGRSGGFSTESIGSSWSSSDSAFPLNYAMAHEVEPTRDIRCEFCGEYFENRKGLSSHARSHLRQMGITEWSVNGSPIDTLREVMHKRGAGGSSRSDHGVKKESGQGAGSPQWDAASEGLAVSGFQSTKFRKSPLSLLQSGPRLHKQGVGSAGASATLPAGKFFRMSPLGKRPLSEEPHSADAAHSAPHRLKTFSPLPQDFSFKRKPSPDKHGHQDPSCELCGFYFENRKALASHARAHLRQFGVTEWCVNGSPIETLSAWMRSRPQKVLEMHRSYMQGNRSAQKKKPPSSSSSTSSSSQWASSLAVSLVRPQGRDPAPGGSSKTPEGDHGGGGSQAAAFRAGRSSPGLSRLGGGLQLQAQVARSELNVRLPRGFERRPLKHPSCPDGAERDSGPPKPPRTGTVPALVPKPPSYPLVKLVGKFYTLKCRFCEVEFHGPLSVQEDWIRHLQQHILKMNYSKPAAESPGRASASSSTSRTTSTAPALGSASGPAPTPPAPPALTATEIVQVSEEPPALAPTPIPLQTQTA